MKLREWLNTPDDEGLTGKDAILIFCINLAAWGMMIGLVLLERGYKS